jgi:hypothetical protein
MMTCWMRCSLVMALALLSVKCGGSDSPTAPTPPATPTRVIALSAVTGPVTGTITGGVLTLQGSVSAPPNNGTITAWSTTVDGNTMSGTATYNITFAGTPGVATVVTRFVRVTR